MERRANFDSELELDDFDSDSDRVYDEPSADLLSIHLAEVGKYAIDREANFRCAARILDGQFSILKLSRIKDTLEITEDQKIEIDSVLARPRIKRLETGFESKVNKTNVAESMQVSHSAFIEKAVEKCAEIEFEIENINKLPKESREQIISAEIKSQTEVCNDAEEAFDELVLRNLRLGISVAKRYRNHALSMMDSCQLSYEGLMVAATTFDHESGYQFSTYAQNWARQKLSKGIKDLGTAIRIPLQAGTKYIQNQRIIEEKTQELGRELTARELDVLLKGKLDHFNTIENSHKMASIDKINTLSGGSSALEGYVVDDVNVEEEALRNVIYSKVVLALEKLTEREREVIALRFGKGRTLDSIGQEIGLTRERIRQIEVRALRKLRRDPALCELLDKKLDDS